MIVVKKPTLPIIRSRVVTTKSNDLFVIEVSIEQTEDFDKYPPDGIKATFRILKSSGGVEENELVVLIDNHRPFNYHEHDKLPEEHNSRKRIEANNWQEAWQLFDLKVKEVIK
jgi:hypothetical protein